MRKLRNLFIAVCLVCLLLSACGGETPETAFTYPTEETVEMQDRGELTILFTGDLYNAFAAHEAKGTIGYGALAAYRDQLEDEGKSVVLVDGGNAMTNENAGWIRNGAPLADLIAMVGYDIRVPGMGEFAYGMDTLRKRADKMEDAVYLSCNLTDSQGATVFAPYVILEFGAAKVGFVGITAPHAADTLDDEAYGFCPNGDKDGFYAMIQDAIDAASNEGADFVIAVSSLGTDPEDTPWTSAEVIANTTGLALVLDCGSGAVLEGNTVKDLDNYEIPICAAGSDFAYVGEITLDLNDGTVAVELRTALGGEDKTIAKEAADLQKDME